MDIKQLNEELDKILNEDKRQRAFEVRNMHTGIHELWVVKSGVRAKEIQDIIDMVDGIENDEDYEIMSIHVSNLLDKKIENSFEVNFRDKDANGNYDGYIVINKNHIG